MTDALIVRAVVVELRPVANLVQGVPRLAGRAVPDRGFIDGHRRRRRPSASRHALRGLDQAIPAKHYAIAWPKPNTLSYRNGVALSS